MVTLDTGLAFLHLSRRKETQVYSARRCMSIAAD
jgi:hypothetical protein